MKEEKISLDVKELKNFRYDASRCILCKGCGWVDNIYMPAEAEFSKKCPSEKYKLFDSYSPHGRMKLILALMEGRLQYSDKLLETLYLCPLCGACDVGCKRNLELEPLLTLEAARIKCVQDGAGPLPQHKKMAERILTYHNSFGMLQKDRLKWLPSEIKPDEEADILYFVGCNSSFNHSEIAVATVKILNTLGINFTLLGS